jgi:hypothetical protein
MGPVGSSMIRTETRCRFDRGTRGSVKHGQTQKDRNALQILRNFPFFFSLLFIKIPP